MRNEFYRHTLFGFLLLFSSVAAQDLNNPPELNPITNQTVLEDSSLTVVVSASDVDSDSLTFDTS